MKKIIKNWWIRNKEILKNLNNPEKLQSLLEDAKRDLEDTRKSVCNNCFDDMHEDCVEPRCECEHKKRYE